MQFDRRFNEFVNELVLSQDSGKKYAFKKYAMEAFNTPTVKARLVEIIYKDINSMRNINYNDIDNSKGDFTKFKYYELFYRNLTSLNELLSDANVEELKDLNKLHEILIEARSDFEHGYKFEIDLIKAIYNTLVMAAMEYLNVCIIAYVDYLKEVKQILFYFKVRNKNNYVLFKNVKYIIASYNNGDWRKVMNEFKKNNKNFAAVGVAAGILACGLLAIVASVALFSAIRELIYFFYSRVYSIAEWAKIQNDFLKESMKHEKNDKALKKQEWLSSKLQLISDMVEGKTTKRNDEAKKKIKESNNKKIKKSELEKDVEIINTSNDSDEDDNNTAPPGDTIVF